MSTECQSGIGNSTYVNLDTGIVGSPSSGKGDEPIIGRVGGATSGNDELTAPIIFRCVRSNTLGKLRLLRAYSG